MGTTFSTIQVQNRQQISKEQFIKSFSKQMEKKGLMSTTAEKAQFSYRLAFSNDNNWVTLSSSEYVIDTESFDLEVQRLAKAMKTCCIGTSVFDSDVSLLYLVDAPNKNKDRVAIGAPDTINNMLDMEYSVVRGKEECWNLLLVEGETWENLTSIWNNDYVFAEEALSRMAPLLGIDSVNIVTDYQFWDEVEQDKSLLSTLYFQTASPVFINDGATKLAISTMPIMVSGEMNIITFYNIGGISSGLTILFVGDCFKDDAVIIDEIQIEKCKNPRVDTYDWLSNHDIVTAHPTKKQIADGRYGLFIELNDFVFPEGVNVEHPSMKGKKGMDAIFTHQILLRFKATIQSGSKHDSAFYAVPQKNWQEGLTGAILKIYKTRELLNLEFLKK